MLQENRTATSGQDPYVKDTPNLIASDKVEGTAVYGIDADRIGSIQRIILEKRGGRVGYAVLSFGGFLGIAQVIEIEFAVGVFCYVDLYAGCLHSVNHNFGTQQRQQGQ